ncbi:hypothetical protein BVG19_g3373 [[Candida] boidinii]|nr:hypothetical protein BVG19_g3373 [[Candida] boidinii]OWB53210.1 hypothetical protein B5S27_g4803 [[Candida] boidinii]
MTVNSAVDTPSSKTQTPAPSFYIQERLDNLYDIDTKVVSLLDNLSCALNNLQEGKKDSKLLVNPNNNNNNNHNATAAIASAKIKRDEKLSKFKENCSLFYANLSDAAILLRKEIKLLDNRSSGINNNNNNNNNTKNNDNLDSNNTNILPITVNKKAIWMGKAQMDAELNELDKLVKENVIQKEQSALADNDFKVEIEQSQSDPQSVKSLEDKHESVKVKKEEELEPMVGIKQESTTVSDPLTATDTNITDITNASSNVTSIDKPVEDVATSKTPESSTKIKNENTETLDIFTIPQEIPIKEVNEVAADDDAEIDLDDADLDDLFSGENNDVGGDANDQVLLDDDDLFGDVGNLDDGDSEMGFTS